MRKLNQFLKKSVFVFLLWAFSSLACYSEKFYQISETELNLIQSDTSNLMQQVETLTESVKTLETQRNELIALSDELKTENQKLKNNVKKWQSITLGVCSGAIVGAVTAYFLK